MIEYRNYQGDVSGIEIKRIPLSEAQSPNVETLYQSGSADNNENAPEFLVVKIAKPDVTGRMLMNGTIITTIDRNALQQRTKLSQSAYPALIPAMSNSAPLVGAAWDENGQQDQRMVSWTPPASRSKHRSLQH